MRKMSSLLLRKGMAATLSAAMMFGVFGEMKTSVLAASAKKVDADVDGRANETITVNDAKGARMIKVGSYVKSPGELKKGDTYFALESKDNAEFINLFDSCNGTIAFNETFRGNAINTTDGKYSFYGCDNGGVAGQPILGQRNSKVKFEREEDIRY